MVGKHIAVTVDDGLDIAGFLYAFDPESGSLVMLRKMVCSVKVFAKRQNSYIFTILLHFHFRTTNGSCATSLGTVSNLFVVLHPRQ